MRKNNERHNAVGQWLFEVATNCNETTMNGNEKPTDLEGAVLYFLCECQTLLTSNEVATVHAKKKGTFRKIKTLSEKLKQWTLSEVQNAMDHCHFESLSETEKEKYVSLMAFFSAMEKRKDEKGWRKLKKELKKL